MKTTYEEACELGGIWITAERVARIGIDNTMRIYLEELAKTGWTTETLCQEAKARMHARIEEMSDDPYCVCDDEPYCTC